jgi:hypothetical protein
VIADVFKDLVKGTPAYPVLVWWRNKRQVAHWRNSGNPSPPDCYKYAVIQEYGVRHGIRTMIETGTLHGNAIHANLRNFDRIYSIELSEDLHRRAVERFRRSGHVKILQGDSGKVLPKLLAEISVPALFWLDGHYCGPGTAKGDLSAPIEAELGAILEHPIKKHVILIDDAACFDGTCDYPTVVAIREFVLSRQPDARFEVADNIMRICPPTGLRG